MDAMRYAMQRAGNLQIRDFDVSGKRIEDNSLSIIEYKVAPCLAQPLYDIPGCPVSLDYGSHLNK
ncbi:hypothetical protein GX50_00820 [[Emmonsia] crescens]|uniref:Uncharacterized protein n=1 Tax=[Emmonsia] crescens TaxID=73230 RepID=A0A2B7ZRN6_9EURO|nr:hypothetical protein GX50_00820 [Emmonsia crescens]